MASLSTVGHVGSRFGLANSGPEEKQQSEVKQQGNRVQRWIQASRNGHRGLQDLQHAAAQWGLHLDATADADSILLVLVVILVQRAYRLRLAVFSMFGNMLFARSPLNGQPLPADYGSIHFPHDVENSMYLVCADTTSPTLLANFMMHGPWKLPRPNLIITITGGARDFELKPARLARLFAQGIVEAALTANAIVTAAGTDAGVAKLVAGALNQSAASLPMLGLAPFRKVTGWRELLANNSGTQVSYTDLPKIEHEVRPDGSKGPPLTANLNGDHTHFVLVDDGGKRGDAWGAELTLRAELESAFADMLRVPIVLLCVQGGPGTVRSLYEACLKGTPVVVVAESGGCSTVVYEFCKKGKPIPKSYSEAATWEITEVKRLNEERDSRLLTFFSLEKEDTDLSTVMLKAVVNLQIGVVGRERDEEAQQQAERKAQRNLSRALKLAVQWDRIDVAQDILDTLGGMRFTYPNGAGSTPAAQDALQMAIQLGRIEFCRQLIAQPGMEISGIDMTSLYLLPGRFNFLSNNRMLAEGFSTMFAEHKRRQSLRKGKAKNGGIAEPRRGGSLGGRSKVRADEPSFTAQGRTSATDLEYFTAEDKYYLVVGPLFGHISSRLKKLILDDSRLGYADVYFWAVMSGEFELAKIFWSMTGRPLATAMLGSYVCRHMEQQIHIGKKEVIAQSEIMQDWVVGTLDQLPEESTAHATLCKLLTSASDESRYNLVDLALFLDMKRVLSQRYTQTLIDKFWRGDVAGSQYPLPKNFRWWQVALWSFMPVFSPPLVGFVWGKRSVSKRGKPVYIFDAFAQAKLLLSKGLSDAAQASGQAGPAGTADDHDQRYREDLSALRSVSRVLQHERSVVTAKWMNSRLNGADDVDDGYRRDGQQGDGSRPTARQLQKQLLTFYRIPAVKFFLRTVPAFALATLSVATLMVNPTRQQIEEMAPTMPSLVTPEIALFALAGAKLLDGLHQNLVKQRAHLVFDSSAKSKGILQLINQLKGVFLIVCVIMRLVTVVPRREGGYLTYDRQIICYNVYAYVKSINSCMAVLNLAEPLSLASEDLNVLVIMLDAMMGDIYVFFKLSIIIILGFTFSFIGLEWIGSTMMPEELANPDSNISDWGYGTSFAFPAETFFSNPTEEQKPFWAASQRFERCCLPCSRPAPHHPARRLPRLSSLLFTSRWPQDLAPDCTKVSSTFNHQAFWGFLGEKSGLPRYDVVGDVWMWLYVFISAIVLVNLLIAMMADTYGRVKENSEIEALAARYRRIFEHRRLMLTVPPPFNLPWVVPDLILHLIRAMPRLCRRVSHRGLSGQGSPPNRPTEGSKTLKRKRLQNISEEAQAKQTVRRFLEDEARREAGTVESLAASAAERVAKLEESFNDRMTALTEETFNLQFRALSERVEAIATAVETLAGGMIPQSASSAPSTLAEPRRGLFSWASQSQNALPPRTEYFQLRTAQDTLSA